MKVSLQHTVISQQITILRFECFTYRYYKQDNLSTHILQAYSIKSNMQYLRIGTEILHAPWNKHRIHYKSFLVFARIV